MGKLPLATAGDYMGAPADTTGAAPGSRPSGELAGSRRRAEALRALAETSYSTKLDPTDAPTFSTLAKRVVAGSAGPGLELAAADSLQRELRLVEQAQRPPRGASRSAETRPGQADRLGGALGPGRKRGRSTCCGPSARRSRSRARRRGYRIIASASTGRAGWPPCAAASPPPGWHRTLALPFAYGWKLGIGVDLPPYPVGPNAMTTFLGDVSDLDRGWTPPAARRSSIRMGHRRLRPRLDGSIRVRAGACGRRLTATDAAGHATIARIPPCG